MGHSSQSPVNNFIGNEAPQGFSILQNTSRRPLLKEPTIFSHFYMKQPTSHLLHSVHTSANLNRLTSALF